MRSFEERMEEIQRRGMVLRKQKKHRAFACTVICCLMCFCAGLWLAVSPPDKAPEIHLQDTTPPTTQPPPTILTENPQYSLHSPTTPQPQLEIRHSGSVYLCTDPEQMAEIQGLLDTFSGDLACTEDNAVTDFQEGYLADSVMEAELIFTLGNEITASYALNGNVLTDRITGGYYVLTQETLIKLNQLIGKDEIP